MRRGVHREMGTEAGNDSKFEFKFGVFLDRLSSVCE